MLKQEGLSEEEKNDALSSTQLRHWFKKLISLDESTDEEATVRRIKDNIDFKGINIWILIFSIFIASLGLNMNSTAVIIGAMLISPLMGPIVGVGLAFGINDIPLLTKSLKNLLIAVVISLLTSAFYFLISPIGTATSELLGRTQPSTFDVFIAFFGGLAGIVATSRKEPSNAVAGVAIATALMPPLCTAGYGLAHGNFTFFFGALYLFFINSVFIFIATLIIIRYLKFKRASFIDAAAEKKVKLYLLLFAVLTIIPSVFIGYNIVRKSVFESRAEQFVNNELNLENSTVVNSKAVYNADSSTIEVAVIGKNLSEADIKNLNEKLQKYGMSKTYLVVHQNEDSNLELEKLNDELKSGIIDDIFKKNEDVVANKDKQIELLKEQLSKMQRNNYPISQISDEVKIIYPQVNAFTVQQSIIAHPELGKIDSLPAAFVSWKRGISKKEKEDFGSWLKVRLNIDTLTVIDY